MASSNPGALLRRLAALDVAPGDLGTLRTGLERLVREAIGYDFAAFGTVDPATLIGTSCTVWGVDFDMERERRVFALEFDGGDVNHYADLAVAPVPAGSLLLATDGEPQRSRRHRELLVPLDAVDDLRVVFRDDGGQVWGELTAYRTSGRAPFSPDDVALVATIAPAVAQRLRRTLLEAAVLAPDRLDDPPGLLVAGPSGAIEWSNAPAAQWLDRIDDRDRVPVAVTSLVAATRAGHASPSVALPMRQGGLVALHASTLKPEGASGDAHVSVIIEGARDAHLASVIASAWGLTAREREVVTCVARGLATKQAARELGISEYTVQDHLKAVFGKAGVRTRAALLAALRGEFYEPRVAAGSMPSPYGWYLDDEVA